MVVGILYCPRCGNPLSVKDKSNRGVVTCSKHGDIYVDLEP